MAESFSVKAILSAQDKGFKSVFGAATKSAKELKSTLMGGIGFGAMMAIGQKAVSVVSGSLSGLTKETINTSDAMQKLQQAMRFSGYAEDEIQRIAGATGTLKTYADKTVFSLQDVMSTFGSLSANGVKDAEKLTESVGNAVAVFGGGAQEFSSVALAFSQAMASGALHAQDWNQIVNASPQLAGGLRKELIKLNPVLGEDFKQAMEDGAITADLLGQAMNNIGMTDMAREAAQSVTTFEGAMGNLEATVTSGMQSIYDSFVKGKAVDAINQFNGKVESVFSRLQTWIPATMIRLGSYWKILKREASQVSGAFGDAFGAIRKELGKLIPAFGSTESVNGFRDAIQGAGDALQAFAGFLEEHADIIARVIAELPKLIVAYKGFKIAKSVAPFVGAFTSAIAGLAGAGISKIAGKLFGISKGQEAVGKSSAASSKKMLASAKAFMMLGAGVALISGGFFLLAQGAKAVADSGPLAVAVLAGMVGAVLALSFGFMSFLKNIKTSPAKMNAASKSFTKMAFAVSAVVLSLAGLALALTPLASLGDTAVAPLAAFGVVVGGLAIILGTMGKKLQESAVGIAVFAGAVSAMALSMTPLAKTGTDGAVAMGTFGVVVGGLVAVFAVFGTALTAAIPAMLAFGATILMVGAGMSLATPFVEALGSVIQILGDVVVQVIGVITGAIVAIFPVFGNFVSTVSDSVSQIVSVVGNTLVNIFKTAGDIITGVIDSLGDGFKKVTDGISKVIDSISGGFSSVLDSVAGIIDSIGSSAKNAGKGFESVADGINTIASLSIVDIAKALGSVAIGLGEISTKGKGIGTVADGLNGVIGAITIASAQISMFSGTLTQLNSTAVQIPASMAMISGVLASFSIPVIDTSSIMAAFASISAGAAALAAQLDSSAAKAGAQFSKSLTNGMNSAANSVQRGVSKITSSANKLISALTNIATQAMSRFNSALSSGASRATSTARSMSTSILSTLNSTSSGAYSCGVYIGQGLARGMESTLGYIRSVAVQMAAAAEAAVRAKAKIHSPSRVFAGLGVYVGEGFALGIESMSRKVAEATQDIVDIPTLSTDMRMRFSGAGDYELSGDHSYSSNATYTIVVPVEYNGREAARVTAEFTQKELESRESMKMRLKGERSHV